MMKKSQIPDWLNQILGEMMKPPYFLDKAKNKAKTTDKNTEQKKNESHSTFKEHSTPKTTYRTEGKESELAALSMNHSTSTSSSMDNEELSKHIASQYDWKIDHTETLNNVMRVETAHGTYAVKQTHISPRNVQFLHDASIFAKKNGFSRVAAFSLTKTKKPYFRFHGNTFYATPWLEGSTVNFSSLEHIGQTAYTLAEFYEATRNFKSKDFECETVYNLAQMTKDRNQDLRQMIQMAEAKASPSEFDSMLLNLKPELQDDSAESLRILQNDECHAFLSTQKRNSGICHLDVIPGNFIYRHNHHVYLLDLDLAAYAPRALDIAHLLRRSMQQLDWMPDTAYTCFLHYNAVQTMPKVEYLIVYSLLRFPYRAWRAAHTHYRFYTDESQLSELRAYKNQEKKRQAFLSEFTKQIENLSAST